jgi:hypothetical protein
VSQTATEVGNAGAGVTFRFYSEKAAATATVT